MKIIKYTKEYRLISKYNISKYLNKNLKLEYEKVNIIYLFSCSSLFFTPVLSLYLNSNYY